MRSTSTNTTRSGVISERSTLTSLRGFSSTRGVSTRGSALGPHESISRTVRHTRTTYHNQSHGYYGTYGHGGYYSRNYYGGYYGGFGTSFHIGSLRFGIGLFSPFVRFGHGLHGHVYHGAFASAYLTGLAWHIVPYHNVGWWGYNYGSRCYWFPRHHYGRYSHFSYSGRTCRVYRPYWYGYARWYDYRPYSYGYSSYVYESLYDEGYDDGYGRGYNRGYGDGAEDASAYTDGRRRDVIGKSRPRVPDSSIDKSKTDASTEYRYEMDRGTAAFTNGDYKTATRAFKEALILSPNSADARYSLAVSAFAEGKYAFAGFALRRGVSLDAEAGKFNVRAAFSDPVVFEDFIKNLESELAENPDDPDLLLVSGWIDLRTGDASSAARKLDRAVANAPQDSSAKVLQREALDAVEQE